MNENLHTIATGVCFVAGVLMVLAGAVAAAAPTLGLNSTPLTETGGGFILASGLIQWGPKISA